MKWLDSNLTDWQRDMMNPLLPGTCVISSATYTKDSAGANIVSYAAVSGGTVACRLDPLGNSTAKEMTTILGREALNRARFLTVPYDAPLAIDRRITIDSKTYEVATLVDEHSARAVRRAIVVRME